MLNRETVELKSHAITNSSKDDWDDTPPMEWRGDSDDLFRLGKSLHALKPHYESFQRNQKILQSLYFRQIGERRDTIPRAHMKTYDWVFESDAINFGQWLEQADAHLYWIAGKAGSGKSTLMKHIHNHHKMQMGLQQWAGTRPVHVASHFFWAAGTMMQQSQEGLLRTLTFQLLTQSPELTPKAFPARWKAALQPIQGLSQDHWTFNELLDGLENLLSAANERCVLIFVDGLDEFNGEASNLIEILETIGRIPNIKICVSSRPWLDFTDAFSNSPWKLYLQDLTRKDIERFTLDTLESNSRFRLFKRRNHKESLDLVSRITDRAEGVFLWVHLAVRSLIRGIVNADDISDLQRRLDELPRQLEPFFERMLNAIDDFYISRTTRILLVLAHARISLPLVTFYFLDRQDGSRFNPTGFLQNWPYVNGEEADKIDRMKRQLIAQFKDLINLYDHPTKGALFSFSVGFIHRTVIEFIGRDNIQEWLYARAGTSFHPATALFEANLEQFKIFSHFWKHPYLHPYLRNWFLASIYYAREIEVTKGISVARQLDQLQEVLDNDPNRAIFRKRSEFVADWWHGSLKTLAISMGLWIYANDTARANEYEAALEPELCIELQSDFVVRDVTDTERAERCVIDTTKPSYSSTLHMFTAAEAEHLSRVREKRHKPLLHRQSSSMGYAADEPTSETQTTRLPFEETRSHRVSYAALSGSESNARPSNAMAGALNRAAPFEVYETKASRPRKFRNLLKFLK